MSPLEITLVILLVTIIAFVYGKVPFSVISTGIILALILTGIKTPAEAFGGFINTNVVMFVAMFVIGADHGYMMDVENRRLKEELSTAKKEAVRWSNKYHDLWYDVKPYLDALHRAPELVCGFLEKILAPKQELTMNVQQRNRRRGQDVEL